MQNKYSRRMWVFFNLLSSNPCTHFSSMYEVYETCGSMDRYAALREARNRLNLDDATFFAVLHARRPVSLIRPRGSYDLSPGRPDFIAHVVAILNTIGFFSIFHAHRPFLLTFYQPIFDSCQVVFCKYRNVLLPLFFVFSAFEVLIVIGSSKL